MRLQMSYSESEEESNFAIYSVSDFDSASKSDPESISNSAFINLGICIFSPCIFTLLNKPAYNSFYPFS